MISSANGRASGGSCYTVICGKRGGSPGVGGDWEKAGDSKTKESPLMHINLPSTVFINFPLNRLLLDLKLRLLTKAICNSSPVNIMAFLKYRHVISIWSNDIAFSHY